MLKTNELRIGNWTNRYGDNHKISVETIFLVEKNELKLLPIPLTPEILEKSGFTKIPHFTITNSLVLPVGRNRQLSIGCVGTPNEMLWLCENEKDETNIVSDLVCLHNYDYDGKLYLHKLQNWFFLLTGEELNITL